MSRCSQPTLKLLTIAVLAVLPAMSAYAGPQQQPPRDRGQLDDAQNQRDQDSGQDRGSAGGGNSLSDAVRRVERNTRGEVLSAERVQYDGRDMHRVKVVDDEGRVRVFMQDPNRRDRRDGGSSRAGRAGSTQPSAQRGNERNDGRSGNGGPQGRQRPTRPTRDEDE